MRFAAFLSGLALLASAVTTAQQFPRTNGLKFAIGGKTEYFRGTNAYWLPFLMDNADIDLAFEHWAGAGIKILRTWGFNDVSKLPNIGTAWFQSFVKGAPEPVINTGPDGLGRLDYVVKVAEKHSIKLLIPFVNNWKDYGGMNAYMQYYNVPTGKNNLAWYRSDKCQRQYKKYIEIVVSRYRNSTAIFAWELANEPRCNGCATYPITDWARSTSAYIKSLDTNHMVTLGDEGFGIPGDTAYPYTTGDGVNFTANLAIKDLDFGTLHLYPESWKLSVPKGSDLVTHHAQACAAAGKPCLFEEYGVADTDKCANIRPWQRTAVKAVGMAGDLYWQAGDAFKWGKSHNDGHTVYPGDGNWKCMVEQHGTEVKAYNAGGMAA